MYGSPEIWLEQEDGERKDGRRDERCGKARESPEVVARVQRPQRGGEAPRTSSTLPSATAEPLAHADDTSQKPKTRNAGMIASFVFELSAYAVKG
jgi:hypothetical protein